ncbi:MAG: LysR family transcriptional regulator [Myxococcales bacterium]|nr:LysR family transcriptional regulator [Myxococcales bacterium]
MARSLAQLDLNLLVALEVLLVERHVTRAARRLGVTQSAMSQTLQRLRDALDDPILVRRGTKMAPSPRAAALAGPLRASLHALERLVLGPPRFDPAASERIFRLAAFDVYSVSVLPRVLARLGEVAPRAAVDVVPMAMDRVYDQLRSDDLDVALMVPRSPPGDLVRAVALEDSLVSMVRADHPILAGEITPAAFVRWPHARGRVADGGPSAIDLLLEAQQLRRHVQLRLPHFLAGPALVSATDLIITMPRSLARELAPQWPVATFAPPLPQTPYTVELVWSRHVDADEGHRWFRELVLEVARGLGPPRASAL